MKFWLISLSIMFLFVKPLGAISNVCFKQDCYKVEIAKTKQERKRGLSGRDYLANNRGMLFVYPSKGFYSFWMKGMNFPLDILWLNEKREIVTFYSGLPPCIDDNCPLFSSSKQALYVLEIPSGSISRLKLKTGQVATFY